MWTGWINEKLKFATDDSYLDPTNLNGKVQKHQNFEQELLANKPRVDEINVLGSKLLEQEHFAKRSCYHRIIFVNVMYATLQGQGYCCLTFALSCEVAYNFVTTVTCIYSILFLNFVVCENEGVK